MSDKSEKNKGALKGSGLYAAVFFVCVLLIIILFFVKKNDILNNLQKTNFFERVGVNTPEFVQNHPVLESPKEDVEIDLMGNDVASAAKENVPVEVPAQKYVESSIEPDAVVPAEEKTKEAIKEPVKPAVKTFEQPKPVVSVAATRSATLYFVTVGSDGSVSRKSVKRELPKSDSPLTDNIRALLEGPTPGEKSGEKCDSLIPKGSRLIGASVKDGVATLNFNDAFEFNPVGVEGLMAQLMQIVYTATEFPTVKSVQFLIEGEKKEYLGLEGQWIGSPLSRSSF